MKKLMLLFAVILIVTACATGNWIKPGASEEDLKKDTRFCKWLADAKTRMEVYDNLEIEGWPKFEQ